MGVMCAHCGACLPLNVLQDKPSKTLQFCPLLFLTPFSPSLPLLLPFPHPASQHHRTQQHKMGNHPPSKATLSGLVTRVWRYPCRLDGEDKEVLIMLR